MAGNVLPIKKSSPDSGQDTIKKILKSPISLPSPPAIAVRVLESVKKEKDSLRELARVVSNDPALTSKILQVANSSIYGLTRKVNSLEMAITVLGSNALKNIALSFVMAGELKSFSGGAFDFEDFWCRSVTNAVAAEEVATLMKIKNDDTFVSALLQDVGFLVMFLTQPEDYIRVMDAEKLGGHDSLAIERKIFGFDHQDLGAALLQKWGLPDCIYRPIQFHHELDACSETERDRTFVLNLSNRLSSLYWGLDSAEILPEIQEWLKDKYHLSPQKIERLIDSIAEKSVEILSTFEVEAKDLRPLSQMLREANLELSKLNCSYEQIVVDLQRAKKQAENLASELMKANEKLRAQAVEDGLTGLYNHRHFHEILAQELERSKRYSHPLSLILFDIDYFKKINDTYGHLIGDQVLRSIAEQMRKVTRNSDALARFGGEEFAIILPETNTAGLRVFGERIRRGIYNMGIGVDGHFIRVTVSVGGTTFVPGLVVDHKDILIDVADKAVYHSKSLGRNRFTFFPLQDYT